MQKKKKQVQLSSDWSCGDVQAHHSYAIEWGNKDVKALFPFLNMIFFLLLVPDWHGSPRLDWFPKHWTSRYAEHIDLRFSIRSMFFHHRVASVEMQLHWQKDEFYLSKRNSVSCWKHNHYVSNSPSKVTLGVGYTAAISSHLTASVLPLKWQWWEFCLCAEAGLGTKEALSTGTVSYQEFAQLFPPPGPSFHQDLYLYLTE